MMPEEIVYVHDAKEPHERKFFVKGILSGNGKQHDASFLSDIKKMHPAIRAVQYLDECSLNVAIYRGFVGDWPEVEQIVFGSVYDRLGWKSTKVSVHRRNVRGRRKWFYRRYFRPNPAMMFDRHLEALLTDNASPTD